MILLFKIRDASGERKHLITASNLTKLTFSKDGVYIDRCIRLSYIIPENCLKLFPEFPQKSSTILLEMSKILQTVQFFFYSDIKRNNELYNPFW